MEMRLNSKQLKTLKAVFTNPVKSDILWQDIESLFKALDFEIVEGKGSRVRVISCEEVATFHRPHPERVAAKGAVKSSREFLMNAGIFYEEGNEE